MQTVSAKDLAFWNRQTNSQQLKTKEFRGFARYFSNIFIFGPLLRQRLACSSSEFFIVIVQLEIGSLCVILLLMVQNASDGFLSDLWVSAPFPVNTY